MGRRGYLRDVEKEKFWRKVLKRQAKSKLTASEFCRREGVSRESFYAWRRTIAQRDREARSPAARSRKATGLTTPSGAREKRRVADNVFVPLTVVDALPPQVEIVSPTGWMVRVAVTVHASALAEVLQAVSAIDQEIG